ncbi:MAG: HDIG domain-containing protein [Deltaproteobacteria bacterium]|nr:MAG: HDIG domain-containing protein [Deltaproteobacteria bacterium]
MLDNIKEHSVVVAKIVQVISLGLIKAGIHISLEKAVAGALLHDIAKTASLKVGGDHAAAGKEICLKHQLDEVADIVGEHVWLKDYSPDGESSEKELVYYADKRVLHTSVVRLDERLHDILERYGRNNDVLRRCIEANFRVCRAVENELFSKLHFGPADLADQIDKTELRSLR